MKVGGVVMQTELERTALALFGRLSADMRQRILLMAKNGRRYYPPQYRARIALRNWRRKLDEEAA